MTTMEFYSALRKKLYDIEEDIANDEEAQRWSELACSARQAIENYDFDELESMDNEILAEFSR